VEDDKVKNFRVNAKVSFVLERKKAGRRPAAVSAGPRDT
jgi:hypothetical protein